MKFREMRRAKQSLSREEALAVLKAAKRGALSMIGDGGHPYGVYMNPHYDESDGKIYFHGSKVGHKVESLRKAPRASFTVIDDGAKNEGDRVFTFRSVVVFGCVEFVDDPERAIRICRALATRFNPSAADIEEKVRRAGSVRCCPAPSDWTRRWTSARTGASRPSRWPWPTSRRFSRTFALPRRI